MLLPRLLRLSNNNVINLSCKFSTFSVTRTDSIQNRLIHPTIQENSKCLYSQGSRSAGYNKDYHSQDGVSGHKRLIYKFAYGQNSVYLAYGMVYGTLLLGLSALPFVGLLSEKFLYTPNEVAALFSIVALHGLGAYFVLTRVPIRIYHDETDKTFTIMTYDVIKPLKMKPRTIPENDVILQRSKLTTFDFNFYVPKSLNKKFVILKEQFVTGAYYQKFISDGSK